MKRAVIALIIIVVSCCEALDVAMKWLIDKFPKHR
jgi:hypothetical protein